MDQRSNSKTSLFLMELIIAIAFFALASAVCVRLFVSAHLLAEKNTNLNNSVLWCQNLAESFYGCKGNIKDIALLYPQGIATFSDNEDEGSLVLSFDENWELTSKDLVGSAYEAIIVIKKEDAKDVYSDVTEYNTALIGKAYVAEVAVIDLRKQSDIYVDIPDDKNLIINEILIDYYIGLE